MPNTKLIALDPGSKNIGLAISDKAQIIAFAKKTYENNEAGIQEILAFCNTENVKTIIIGIPLEHDKFHPSQKLFSQLNQLNPNLELILFNEDYSTQEALVKLKIAGYTQEEIKERRDSMSAQVILEKYLKQNEKFPKD